MRPLILIACFALLAAACDASQSPTASPTTAAATTPGPGATAGATAEPTPAGTPFVWEEFHSDDLFFSLQLPRGWTARRTGPAEGIVLRADGGEEGAMVLTVETEGTDKPFQEMVNDYFASILAEDPNAVEALELPGGRAARATSPTDTGGISVIYLFAPQGNHAKTLSFTWEQPEPNPLWRAIAERFNAYSVRPIIPFASPGP